MLPRLWMDILGGKSRNEIAWTSLIRAFLWKRCQLTAVTMLCYCWAYFGGGHKNVSRDTFLDLFWLMSSYVSHAMRMTCLMHAFCASCHSPGMHDGSCPYRDQSMFPHIIIHHICEYDDNIPWLCVLLCGFCNKHRQMRHMMCFFMFRCLLLMPLWPCHWYRH